MFEVITLLEVQIMGNRWSYSNESKPMFKTLCFHSFATNFDKSLLPLFGPCVGSNKRVQVWV
jgi:hypothetical protein